MESGERDCSLSDGSYMPAPPIQPLAGAIQPALHSFKVPAAPDPAELLLKADVMATEKDASRMARKAACARDARQRHKDYVTQLKQQVQYLQRQVAVQAAADAEARSVLLESEIEHRAGSYQV